MDERTSRGAESLPHDYGEYEQEEEDIEMEEEELERELDEGVFSITFIIISFPQNHKKSYD